MWWWVLGIGGLYLGAKVLLLRRRMVNATIELMCSKIRRHRELARRGNRESLLCLKSFDAVVTRLEKEHNAQADVIVAALQLEGLYPPSAI